MSSRILFQKLFTLYFQKTILTVHDLNIFGTRLDVLTIATVSSTTCLGMTRNQDQTLKKVLEKVKD